MRRLAAIVLPLLLYTSAPVGGADDAEAQGQAEGWLLGDIRSALSAAPAAAYRSVASSMGNGDLLDPRHVAAAEASGLSLDELIVMTFVLHEDRRHPSIVVQGLSAVSAADADAALMHAAILAWQAADWDHRFETTPENEETMVGDRAVLRTTFALEPTSWPYPYPYDPWRLVPNEQELINLRTDEFATDILELGQEAVEYLYVSGDSAIAVIAADDEAAARFLGLLP